MKRDQLSDEFLEMHLFLMQINKKVEKSRPKSQLDLPASHIHAMLILSRHPGLSMTQLAKGMMVCPQQLTRIMDTLVDKELVVRKENVQNRRLVLAELTSRGEATLVGVYDSLLASIPDLDDERLTRLSQAIATIKEFIFVPS